MSCVSVPVRVAAVMVLLLTVRSVDATAQPNRGIFGSSVGSPAQSLSVNGSLGVGLFRTRSFSDDPDVPDRETEQAHGVLSGSIDYRLTGRRAGLTASATSVGRYSPALTDGLVAGHRAAIRGSVQATNSTTLTAGQSLSYQPFFGQAIQFVLDPNDEVGLPGFVDPDRFDERVLRMVTDAGLQQATSRRGSVSVSYTHSATEFEDGNRSWTGDSARVGYSHQVAQGLGVRVGYGYHTARFQDRPPVDFHNVDAGFNFGRALPLTSRTTLSFNTGSAVFKRFDGQVRGTLTGDGRLTHQVGRTGSMFVGGGRNVRFVDGLENVVVTDRVSTGFNGQLGRGASFGASASVARGEVGYGTTPDANTFVAYGAATSLSAALSRSLGLTASYAYRRSEFDRREPLLPLRFSQHHRATVAMSLGQRVGVSLGYVRQRSQIDQVRASGRFGKYHWAWSSVTVRPWSQLGFSVHYAYTEAERDQQNAAVALSRFSRHAVSASVVVSAPLYTRVTR